MSQLRKQLVIQIGIFNFFFRSHNGTSTRPPVCQSRFHGLQARFDQPAREHFPLEDGGLHKQGGGSLVRRKEMRLRIQGKTLLLIPNKS